MLRRWKVTTVTSGKEENATHWNMFFFPGVVSIGKE
jgi:hypothetical protein